MKDRSRVVLTRILKHLPLLLLALASAATLAGCAMSGEAARNVVEYQVRKTFPPLLVREHAPPPGSLAGLVLDGEAQPLEDAVVLVSTVRGQVYQARSDDQGRYRIEDIPPGRYVPLAGAWGYDETTLAPVQIQAGGLLDGIDFTLPHHQATPVNPTDLHIGSPQQATAEFPEPMAAIRYPFTFTLDGLTIDNGQIYLPAKTGQAGALEGDATTRSTLVIIYPSHPLNWDAASVALTRDGYAVLAVGPHGDRGLDIEGHVRDFRAALQLWQEGQLAPLDPPSTRWVAMSGSFGSLILFRALRDLPQMPPALVDVGGVSDAFLGVQALYADREALAIPPPYDSAVAAMGRPDRDPAFFFAYSPVFFAGHLPPTFVIHTTNDEVIPYNQAEAMDAALTAGGVPHEFLLYQDTTHYLDAYHPTKATFMVYQRVLDFVRRLSR